MTNPNFQSILITGASSGIGAALADHFACPGVMLWLGGRNKERLSSVADRCRQKGAKVETSLVNVENEAEMQDWLSACHHKQPLDLVIANAGVSIGPGKDGIEPMASLKTLMDINVNGVINSLYPAMELMANQPGGQIALVSSLAGFRGMPSSPAYSSSKVFVKAWGQAIHPHLARQNTGLSVIFPGFVESGITAKNRFPMPMLMTAEKAAKIIAKGLSRNKAIIAFPWPMHFLVWLMMALPAPISDRLLRKLPSKN